MSSNDISWDGICKYAKNCCDNWRPRTQIRSVPKF